MSSAAPPGSGPAPEPGGQDGKRRRHQWGRVVVVVLAAALLITVIVVDRQTLAQSLSAIGGLDWRWFALAIACECVSLLAFGFSRRRLLQADGHNARIGSVMAITYAGNALSMSIPFAGAQLAAVFSYRQFRGRGAAGDRRRLPRRRGVRPARDHRVSGLALPEGQGGREPAADLGHTSG